MKKLACLLFAVVLLATVPVMASVPYAQANNMMVDLQISASHNLGLTIDYGKWVDANGASWRKVYASQKGKRIAILLQWDDRDGSYFTVSTENDKMSVTETLSYLEDHITPSITQTSINGTSIGFRVNGLKRGYSIMVRWYSNMRQSRTFVAARNGWHWLRKANYKRAIIYIYYHGKIVTSKAIRF